MSSTRPAQLSPASTARAIALSTLAPLLGVAALTTAAQAASVTCQAINATGLLTNNIPGPACTTPVNVGDSFEIDFSDVFTSNPGDFSVGNTYSLQIANIDTTFPTSQLNFSNVELLITGALGSTIFSTPTAISIWQATGQTGQGVSGYSTNGVGQSFGFGEAFKSANFTLTAPQPLGTFGTAGVINTIPFNLTNAGITSFTSARIRGVLSGATDVSGNPNFSAGLAIFTTNDPTNQSPNIIYGNAYDASTVPGPLPALGAGAAFGFSRKMRRRLKAAANA